MNRKDSPQSVIDSYRRRQQMAPYFMAGLAILLVVVGIIILVVWFAGSGGTAVGSVSLFASATPTVTETATPTPVTPTVTPTITVTVTNTPTITETATPSGPIEYTVQEGDNCWDLSAKYEVDFAVLLAINNFGDSCPLVPGGKIFIPQPGAQLPTSTPEPTTAGSTSTRMEKIEYVVKFGDTLDSIASENNTTVEAIMKDNKLTDANTIDVGQKLILMKNSVTRTPTKAPTNTITPGGPTLTGTATATVTPKP